MKIIMENQIYYTSHNSTFPVLSFRVERVVANICMRINAH